MLSVFALLITTVNKDEFLLVYLCVLPYIIFYLAYIPEGIIRSFNRLGDYSYGMYIYAFPVQQSISALFPKVSVYSMIALSLLVTLTLAVLSWHLIEVRALKLKKLNIFGFNRVNHADFFEQKR